MGKLQLDRVSDDPIPEVAPRRGAISVATGSQRIGKIMPNDPTLVRVHVRLLLTVSEARRLIRQNRTYQVGAINDERREGWRAFDTRACTCSKR